MKIRLLLALIVTIAASAVTGCATKGSGANNIDHCIHPHSDCYNHRVG